MEKKSIEVSRKELPLKVRKNKGVKAKSISKKQN